MMQVWELILEIASGLVGFGALYLLFGKRLKFSGQKLPWYGFRRLPNGDIHLDPDLVAVAGLVLLVVLFAVWITMKSMFGPDASH
jgi:hypothetical protein